MQQNKGLSRNIPKKLPPDGDHLQFRNIGERANPRAYRSRHGDRLGIDNPETARVMSR